MTKSVKRWFKELKPQHYALELAPDMKAMTFAGTVTIHLKKTGRPSQRITFHQHGLTIDSATIIKHDKKGDQQLTLARINNQDSLDEVRLHTKEQVYSGDYTITMTFHGTITRVMTGLYPSFFKIKDTEHLMLSTQFESHYAREVFPCIDEPEAKATFDLTLTAPSNLTVLANTPATHHSPAGKGLTKTTFETTPRMSTYLLAFVIGELHKKSTKTKRGTEVSVWCTIAHPLDSVDFALDVARKTIEFFEDYFGVDYPLTKLDHVAVPDFSVGAMENWGLIIYREAALLAYPGETAQSSQEWVAVVVAHETSHQWFGDLVTMQWWDDTWLNESFAILMEYVALSALFPEWQMWNTFAGSQGLAAIRRDATPGVQAVHTEVRHPDEINSVFDPSIVYAKGGRLLYMLMTLIGEDAFRKGLAQYFKKHAYGNTIGSDLWEALGKASGQDLGAFMKPWLERSGFPAVGVERNGQKLKLSQKHFLESGEVSDGRIWPVPLFTNHAELPYKLEKPAANLALTSDEPVIINQGYAGHYLVHYQDTASQQAIVNLIANQKLGVPDRLMTLNGAGMLAKAGSQTYGEVLELLSAYKLEDNEAVWGMIALAIGEARGFIDLDERLESSIKSFVIGVVSTQLERLGWDEKPDESSLDRKLRGTITALAAYSDDPGALAGALQRFQAYQKDPAAVSAEVRATVFGVPVRTAQPDAFDYLVKLHDGTNNSDLRSDCMAGLCATRKPSEAKKLLARLTHAELVKPQDADIWLIYLLRNRYTRSIAWDWMVANWQWVVDTYAHDKAYDHFPRYSASICNTKQWADKYKKFFGPKTNELSLKRNIEIGLSEIDTRVTWLERDLSSVQDFFRQSIQ